MSFENRQGSTSLQNNFLIQSPTTPQFDIDEAQAEIFQPIWKKSQPIKPCVKYGLDLQKLQVEDLLKHRSYRRLYNIVVNDQTQPDQIFRPNLIKQLYFLLQITPFIDDTLKDGFLNKIEQLYNSNDHKKIQLSKNLDGMVKNVLSKSKSQIAYKKVSNRPKSGVQWDTTLISSLRPYTAKIRNNKTNQNKSMSRPESSKFGISTHAYTNEHDHEQHDRQYEQTEVQREEADKYNQEIQQNQNMKIQEYQQICDIQEEWERNLDFKKKHRTLHPQQQPTFQKLMGIIQAVKQKIDRQAVQTPKSIQAYRSQKNLQKKRKIQSAALERQKQIAKALVQQQFQLQNQQNKNEQQFLNQDEINDDGEKDQYNQQQAPEEQQQNEIEISNGNKLFTKDKRTKQGKIKQVRKFQSKMKDKMYTNLNGVKIIRPFTAKQNHVLVRLDQYSSIQQNKRVLENNLDQECADRYRDFMRKKNIIKRESVRKSQTKRYMSNFMEMVKVLPSNKGPKMPNLPQSKMKPTVQAETQKKQNKENLIPIKQTQQKEQEVPVINIVDKKKEEEDEQKLFGKRMSFKGPLGRNFDFSNNGAKEKAQENTYNVKQFFEPQMRKQMLISLRGIHKLDGQPHLQNTQNCSKMTYIKRISSQQKFNPVHSSNIEKFNQQALEQVERIKNRLGGKLVASTNSLMKALYIDSQLPNINQYGKSESTGDNFVLPDKRYLMIQKQEKKKKKRKVKKSSNKKSPNKENI